MGIAPMASAEEQGDGSGGRMPATLTLQDVLKTLGSRMSCNFFVMTTDTRDRRGEKDRFKVSLVSDSPNPCSMDELACSIPRSTYVSVGLSRDSVRTEAILKVNSSEETFTVHDATNDDMSTATVVPPFNSRIYGNGSISVQFHDIPSSLMNDSPDPNIRVPGTAFGNSARAVVANILSRMRWLRKQTIDDVSLAVEDDHYIYGRDPFYGSNLAKPKIRLIRPDDGADSEPLLPTRIKINGIGVETLTSELRTQAYEDLSPNERTLYSLPNGIHTFERMKSALATWKLSYDRIESSRSEWMPFRNSYDAQFTVSGRATKKNKNWGSVQVLETQSMREIRERRISRISELRQAPVAPGAPQGQDGNQPADQTGRDGDGEDASNDLSKTRVESKHAFYVALEQEDRTEADKRQLYKVEISILAPAPFKGFDTLSIKSPQEEKKLQLIKRLGQYLSRIPDRTRIAAPEDVASRNPYLMSLRNMLVIAPDVDVIDALDQLFSNNTAKIMLERYSDDNVDTMAKFIGRMEKAGLLNTAAKIAFLAIGIVEHLGKANIEVLGKSLPTVVATIRLIAEMCGSFTKYIIKASGQFLECRALIRSWAGTPDLLHVKTPDTDERNVSIAIDTLRLINRDKEPINPEATSVSPARDEDLKRVIYRAICRLQCNMDADINRKLDQRRYEGHPFGLYVMYQR